MYKIVKKQVLNNDVKLYEIYEPLIAKKALPGQFIMLRVDENGERIPLTIAETDSEKGLVTIIVQEVGATTKKLGLLNEGDCLHDFVGPLGRASEYHNVKKVAVIGGGLGCAIAYPQAKYLYNSGVEVDLIAGFRNRDLVIIEDKMKAACNNLYICTDDGSYGEQGFVTDKLRQLIDAGNDYDEVIAIGPLVMMKFVSKLTKEYGIKTTVSMNSIMIDGTGMCGGCRLSVGGEIKFACVDGPDFDGHLVDFDEIISRNTTYGDFEKNAVNKHNCRLGGNING